MIGSNILFRLKDLLRYLFRYKDRPSAKKKNKKWKRWNEVKEKRTNRNRWLTMEEWDYKQQKEEREEQDQNDMDQRATEGMKEEEQDQIFIRDPWGKVQSLF